MLFNNILCALDYSEFSDRACRYAFSLAKQYGAHLDLLQVVEPYVMFGQPEYAIVESTTVIQQLHDDAAGHVHELAKKYERFGVTVKELTPEGSAAAVILDTIPKESIDLVVMGTHGRSGFDRFVVGSVTEKVMRKANCPVLIIRKPAHDFVDDKSLAEPVHLRRILACTDFSAHSERAVRYAASLAAAHHAELSLVHVLASVPEDGEIAHHLAQTARHMKTTIPEELRHASEIHCLVRIGQPYQEILQLAAQSQADLVVMGVAGRHALDTAVFGSTAHRVIQLGSCPVLAVHI